jgi:hypothetical protein
MLQAHSPLWYYLWLAPNLLLLILAFLIWPRKVHQRYPVFLIFAVVTAVEQFALLAADVIPSVSATTWWYVFWASLLVDALIKFALIGEIFGGVFGLYPSVAKLGRWLISAVGVLLVLVATIAAAYTSRDNIHWFISGAHVLEQTIYLIECGLIFFLFLFAAYFKLSWGRFAFGITLGLGISACVHLATWALMAGAGLSVYQRNLLNFLNMATYHACVLIWFYYFLVPGKNVSKHENPKLGDPSPPEHNLDLWNQELERLIHQ